MKVNRFIAYFIDLLIISIFAILLAKINYINPQRAKYETTIKEFNKYNEKALKDVNNMNSIITNDYMKYIQKVEKYGASFTISETLIIILYFTFFPMFNRGSTIGQRLMRLRVVKQDGDVPWYIYFIRSLLIPIITTPILYTAILNIILIPLVFLVGFKLFFYLNIALSLIICIYSYIDSIMMLKSKEGLSLHDKITKTKVVTISSQIQ